MADNTLPGVPSAKRRKTHDKHEGIITQIHDLPDDAVKLIMAYDMTNALSTSSRTFRAIKRTFTPYKVTVSHSTLHTVVCYPRNTTNTQRVVLKDCSEGMRLVLSENGFSEKAPRFPHATVLIVETADKDSADGLSDMILALVNIKKIRYLDVRGVATPSLQLLKYLYASGASPVKLGVTLVKGWQQIIRIMGMAERLYVHVPHNSGAVEFNLHPRIKTMVFTDYVTHTAIPELRANHQSICKLRIGSTGPPNTIKITDPSLYHALIRGGQPCIFAPSGKQWLGDVSNITLGSYALEGFLSRVEPIPNNVRIPHHAMLVAIQRFISIERNLQLETPSSLFYSARPAILEEVPTSAKFTMAEWTAMRATALIALSFMIWDDHEVYKSLVHTWASCCCKQSTTRDKFMSAAIEEIHRQIDMRRSETGGFRFNRGGPGFVREHVFIPFLVDNLPKNLRTSLNIKLAVLENFGSADDDDLDTHSVWLNEDMYLDSPLPNCMLHANCNPWE